MKQILKTLTTGIFYLAIATFLTFLALNAMAEEDKWREDRLERHYCDLIHGDANLSQEDCP